MTPEGDRDGTVQASGEAPASPPELKDLPFDELQKRLDATPGGLTQAEAEKRLAETGPNELAEKAENLLLKFLGYFWGPIPWMIEIAVVLSALARHWPDFGIILVLLVANVAALVPGVSAARVRPAVALRTE